MKKRKHGTIGSNANDVVNKFYPEINIGGPLNAMTERVGFGNTGASLIDSKVNLVNGIITVDNQIEDELGQSVNARLDFFDNFFSVNNKMPLGRVMVYGDSCPRRYTIVRFAGGKFFNDWSYQEPKYAPIPIKNPSNNLEEYLRYLYAHMVEEVEYLEGMTDEEFQAVIKALFVNKKLIINELEKTDDPVFDIRKREKVTCLTDEKNALYWVRDDVIPNIDPNYLKVLNSRYNSLMEGSVNIPDFKSLYKYFKENPHPNMKVLKLEDASENPFNFLR